MIEFAGPNDRDRGYNKLDEIDKIIVDSVAYKLKQSLTEKAKLDGRRSPHISPDSLREVLSAIGEIFVQKGIRKL